MEDKKLHVLIVSGFGAHQKAIRAMCSSMPHFGLVETVSDTNHALDMFKFRLPDLLILGANIAESKAFEFLGKLSAMSNPPYCIALTLSDNEKSIEHLQDICQMIPTRSFSRRFPEISNEVYAM